MPTDTQAKDLHFLRHLKIDIRKSDKKILSLFFANFLTKAIDLFVIWCYIIFGEECNILYFQP